MSFGEDDCIPKGELSVMRLCPLWTESKRYGDFLGLDLMMMTNLEKIVIFPVKADKLKASVILPRSVSPFLVQCDVMTAAAVYILFK